MVCDIYKVSQVLTFQKAFLSPGRRQPVKRECQKGLWLTFLWTSFLLHSLQAAGPEISAKQKEHHLAKTTYKKMSSSPSHLYSLSESNQQLSSTTCFEKQEAPDGKTGFNLFQPLACLQPHVNVRTKIMTKIRSRKTQAEGEAPCKLLN